MGNDNLLKQKHFYDNRWSDFNFANRLKLLRCIAILNEIASTKLFEPKILDLGCGAGWLAGITGIFGPTTAIDLSKIAIDKASTKFPYVNFFEADILNLQYEPNSFDIVISQEVIEHLENVTQQENYIKIAFNILKPGGFFIITTPNRNTFEAMTKESRIKWSNQPYENLLSPFELKKLIKKYFQLLRFYTIIPGYGQKNFYRIVNSKKLMEFLDNIKIGWIFNELRLRWGYGLHFLVTARELK